MWPHRFVSAECILAFTLILLLVPAMLLHQDQVNYASKAPPVSPLTNDPRLVYSDDPNDSWNLIFHLLFTRTIKVRMSDEFPESGPFVKIRDSLDRIKASTRIFERFENGDRSIEPLYPSFFNNDGVLQVLNEPRYSELSTALKAALAEKSARSPLERALMQSDVWATFDTLVARTAFSGPDKTALRQKRDDLVSLLARLTRKLLLTPEEIRALPNNYQNAAERLKLPALFSSSGGWVEVQLHRTRLHDDAADFRRSARVFFKPADRSMGSYKFLEALRHDDAFYLIDSVALVVQNLLIDSMGDAVPTWLTTDVQVRKFVKDPNGKVVKAQVHQFELSRRSLLSNPTAGGLFEIVDNEDLFFPASGNDYLFASPQFTRSGNDYPVLVKLNKRCEGCHGAGSLAIFTLSSHVLPPPLPPLNMLSAQENVHGWYVAGRKFERDDFKALREQWRYER